jgi:hypothetical protein
MVAVTPTGLHTRWAYASRPCRGERRNGDRLVAHQADGTLTLALIDIAGHGDPAADLADAVAEALAPRLDDPPIDTLRWAHTTLLGTRGAAMGIARFDVVAATITWTAVGNVTCRWVGGPQLVSRDGLLGARTTNPRTERADLIAGATWLLATDGLLREAGSVADTWRTPDEQVRNLLTHASRPLDDATCAIVQVLP